VLADEYLCLTGMHFSKVLGLSKHVNMQFAPWMLQNAFALAAEVFEHLNPIASLNLQGNLDIEEAASIVTQVIARLDGARSM
jgi:hypothetical protein